MSKKLSEFLSKYPVPVAKEVQKRTRIVIVVVYEDADGGVLSDNSEDEDILESMENSNDFYVLENYTVLASPNEVAKALYAASIGGHK